MTFEEKQKFEVYYRIRPTFREDELPHTQKQFEQKYKLVKTVEAEDKEQAFSMMQAESWSPNGEAREAIRKLGLRHTSMSIGDLLKDGKDRVYVVNGEGFKWVPITPNRVMRKVIGMTVSPGKLTREGNPTGYWYVLECGHVALESHHARTFMEYKMVNEIKNIPMEKNCHYCQYKKPVNKETTIGVLEFFRARELNDDMIALYKKVRDS